MGIHLLKSNNSSNNPRTEKIDINPFRSLCYNYIKCPKCNFIVFSYMRLS